MTDGDHLYRAILCDPADDTLRLAYADWLDETAGTEECTRCKDRRVIGWDYVNGVGKPPKEYPCPECTAPGYEPKSDGRRERAEFIRVQCRLATPCVTCTPVCSQEYGHAPPCELGLVGDLRRRERQLFDVTLDGKAWLFPPPDGFDSRHLPVAREGQGRCAFPRGACVTYRRGFVSEVRLPAAAFLGGVCGRCYGTQVEAAGRADNWVRDCSACNGTGRTPGLAEALFSRHPITEVVLSDVEPIPIVSYGLGGAIDHWRLEGLPPELRNPDVRFGSRNEALDWLSARCVVYGRREAGILEAVL
jgi:uncharacterized protein (TIGR02996 family)